MAVLGFDVMRDADERGGQDAEVVRKARKRHDIRDGVHWKDEVAEGSNDDSARPRRRVRILQAVIENQGPLNQLAAGFPPETPELPPERVVAVNLRTGIHNNSVSAFEGMWNYPGTRVVSQFEIRLRHCRDAGVGPESRGHHRDAGVLEVCRQRFWTTEQIRVCPSLPRAVPGGTRPLRNQPCYGLAATLHLRGRKLSEASRPAAVV